MTHQSRGQIRQLEKVYQRRVDTAAKEVRVQRELYAKAVAAKTAQEQLILKFTVKLHELTDYRRESECRDSPPDTLKVHAHRDYLNYDIEREQFYLQQMNSDAAEQKRALTAARKIWMQAKDKLERIAERRCELVRELDKAVAQRVEREWEDTNSGGSSNQLVEGGAY